MERKETADSGLLDWLAAECGCGYLSDLRLMETAPVLIQAVRSIPRGQWAEEAWREAASYITGRHDLPSGEDEVRALLEHRT